MNACKSTAPIMVPKVAIATIPTLRKAITISHHLRSFRLDIHAVVSSLGSGTKSKDMQWLYVNRRYVRSSKIGRLMNAMLGTTKHSGNEIDRYDATSRNTSQRFA